ncbi:uncharacterized protein LOC118406881 [Branchiostoma floridae]|uniref:Uncharacterized protein LOC118406881 n=1 Tax=Branchiostoma floridae TaxID=7739 RepID=A0A9J7KKB9_BRAFL|nr:uncharacterized protein LOC118406881 [Branchiostoma floridae]
MRGMKTAPVWMQILFIAFVGRVRTREEPPLCPAGMYMDQKEGCVSCPVGTYSPVPNTFTRCLQHTQCDVQNMISSLGTATHDTVCRCLHGYHWDDATETCTRNLYCPPGEGIVDGGQACTACINGTYSDELSNTEPCIPWTDCSDFGWTVISEGTSKSDRVCSGLNRTVEPTTTNPAVAGNQLSSKDKEEAMERQMSTPSTPSTMGVSIIVLSSVSTLGICILLSWKGYKHCARKRQVPEVLLTDHTAEEAILVNEAPVDKIEESVECEDDSLHTHPKEKECFSACDEHSDSQRLLDPTSDTRPQCPDSGYENTGCEGLEDEGPATESENHRERSTAQVIPQVYTVDSTVSPVASTAASSVQTSPSSLDYREGAQRFVLGVYSDALTVEVVEYLATELGEDWKYVAPNLGLKQHEIDQIINEHRDDIKQQIFAMLCNWEQDKTGDATISDMKETLLTCNRLELLSRLQTLNGHAVT